MIPDIEELLEMLKEERRNILSDCASQLKAALSGPQDTLRNSIQDLAEAWASIANGDEESARQAMDKLATDRAERAGGITPKMVEEMALEYLRKADKNLISPEEIQRVDNMTATTRDAIFLLKDGTYAVVSPKGEVQRYSSADEASRDYWAKGGMFFPKKKRNRK